MRLIEFADAEEQLALWKLINDNVWSAIHAQAQEQAKQLAAQGYKKKTSKRASKGGRVAVAPPPIKLPPQKPLTPSVVATNPTQQNVNPKANAQEPSKTKTTTNGIIANVGAQPTRVDTHLNTPPIAPHATTAKQGGTNIRDKASKIG